MATKKRVVVAPVAKVTTAPESSALVEARAKEAELQVAYETIDKWGVNRLSGLVELLNRTRKVIQDLERL